MSHRVTR